MGKVSKNQTGYSTVELLLLAVIVLIIGFVGWYVYRASNNAYDTYNTAPNSNVAPHKKGAAKPSTSTKKATSTTTTATPAPTTTSTTQ